MTTTNTQSFNDALTTCIGIATRRARTELGLTQEVVAERVGIAAEFYARIERGRSLPSAKTLGKMTDVLNLTLESVVRSALQPE